MCQLTFISTDWGQFTRILLTEALKRNGETINRDGFGFYSIQDGMIAKTKVPAATCTNLGAIIRPCRSRAMMGHVRQASSVAGLKLEVSDELAQPFTSERFILMHNGTLELREGVMKAKSDSLEFLNHLEESNEEDFVTRFNATMAMFYGKFAMLIFDKKTRTLYVCRGEADLHASILKSGEIPVGICINTSRLDGNYWINAGIAQYQLYSTEEIQAEDLLLIPTNTISKVKGYSLEKVGSCKEEHRPFQKAVTVYSGDPYTAGTARNYNRGTVADSNTLSSNQKNILGKLRGFLERNRMDVTELDYLMLGMVGCAFLECDILTLLTVVDSILPAVESHSSKQKRKVWADLVRYIHPLDFYKKDVQYPYFMNDISKLRAILAEVVEEAKRKTQ